MGAGGSRRFERWLRARCANGGLRVVGQVLHGSRRPERAGAGKPSISGDPAQRRLFGASAASEGAVTPKVRCSLSPDVRGYRKQKMGRIAAAPILSRALSASEPSPPRNAVCPGLATPHQAVLLQAKKQSHASPHCPSRTGQYRANQCQIIFHPGGPSPRRHR